MRSWQDRWLGRTAARFPTATLRGLCLPHPRAHQAADTRTPPPDRAGARPTMAAIGAALALTWFSRRGMGTSATLARQ